MTIGKRFAGWVVVGFGLLASHWTSAQVLPSAGYYVTTTNKTGATLKSALHTVIRFNTFLTYSSTRDALFVCDRDPLISTNVILIYSEFSVGTNMWINDGGLWNREHLWPQSFGVNNNDGQSDLFNLRPCDANVNNLRGNLYYDKSTSPSNTTANAPGCSYDGDSWEPRDDEKGQIARSAFYMAVRYEGIAGEDNVPNLELSDSPNAATFTFGKLSTFLAWNRLYPVTTRERNRNSRIALSYQFNRNPFIDNPDFADMVFLGVDGFTAWQGTHFTPAEIAGGGVAGPLDNPDGDGEPNVVECALGHEPKIPDAAPVQSVSFQNVGGTDYLYVTHHKNHYLNHVTLGYQTSPDMLTWTDATPEILSSTQIDPQKDLVTLRIAAPDDARFVRLKISQP